MSPTEKLTSVCASCGHAFEASAAEFGCPACLLQLGLGDISDGGVIAEAEQKVPEEFGAYIIQRVEDGSPSELGRGAMGVTYRAIDTSLHREVALKIVRAGIEVSNADARERFMREARLAASLRHPNVATVYHFGIREETGQCFCAMELIEGETLDERVRRTGPLDIRSVLEVARQITAALGAAEKRGLVHRDLKPSNIMVQSPEEAEPAPAELTVKIIDFGVAKALAETPDARLLTHHGFIGTPAFASPEQFAGRQVDARSDIYSLGATLWFLLTGRIAVEDRLRGGRNGETDFAAPSIEQLKAARVPAPLIALLRAMLATEPAGRPSVRELAKKLDSLDTQILQPSRLRPRVALAAAICVIAAVVSSVVYLREISSSQSSGSSTVKSIAVLPFVNLSADAEDGSFADRVHEEISARLATSGELKVIPRDAAEKYRQRPDELKVIARELGVASVLDGSVHKVGGKVRTTVQLIAAETEQQLWAATYDRPEGDTVAVLSTIAAKVAKALHLPAPVSATGEARLDESSPPPMPIATLLSPAPAASYEFGYMVAISGSRIVVGAHRDGTSATDSGRVHVYELKGATPSAPVFTLDNPTPARGDLFGHAVAISGSRVLVGSRYDDNTATDAGRAYVYDLDGVDPTQPIATLSNPSNFGKTNDEFGHAVAISGTIVVVGAYQTDAGATNSGAAYVFDLTAPDPALPIAQLINPDAAADDQFGISVAVQGRIVVVGAWRKDNGPYDSAGSVYVYDLDHSSPGVPVLHLNDPSGTAESRFGCSVAISGTRVAVGAFSHSFEAAESGSAYVYDLRRANPEVPVFTLHNPFPTTNAQFGTRVAISGTRLLIGCYRDDTGASDAGSVYAYELSGNPPTEPVAKLNHPASRMGDSFGYWLALEGDTAVIGAFLDDSPQYNAGSAFVFNWPGPEIAGQ